ncbi:outer membrane receptor protein involved in Fe transport [Rheinheimera pacifica]|uniref:TonB-dependent receptor domain-containing protein n=1 Tax=Rheinheimera pacifica TaxID=173990 RepID=UPI002858D630|nr:TonB-dependent receptor [Rheinheimera pacifica]MDR6981800.1 outer membrane receptor protein involved in Fe transport [Rheinheimera pacifica]
MASYLSSKTAGHTLRQASKLALAVNLALFSQITLAQQPNEAAVEKTEVITITGSRIARTELVASSPVASVDEVQIQLDRAVNVEDITAKLPQAAAGANATGATVGDSLGSSTIDLRSLGQNRTLVLINGTRAVPFSFRNSVDVNIIPAGLIKRVDVLTGGAAAVYGADAVAGVVNFIMDDKFDGVELSASYETADGGGEKMNTEAVFGGDIANGRGHITGYVGYSERKALLARERSWAMQNSGSMINSGGFYTDVASGNSFGIDDNGGVTAGRNTVNVTGDRYLTQPMDRLSAGLFFNTEFNDYVELYGRGMYAKVKVTGAGSAGQTPISVNEQVTLTADNPYIPAAVRDLISFDANGNALVNVERNLGLGVQYTEAVRESSQFQLGLKGILTDSLSYDVYAQYGLTDETSSIYNNAYRNNNSGVSRFGALANTVDIFDPQLDLSSFSAPLLFANRERTQSVLAATVSGDSAPLFELPAGAVSYALGYEYRKETGKQIPGDAFRNGTSFSSAGVFDMDASFDSKEVYAEVLIPVLFDKPFAEQLDFEGAYRVSEYSNTDAENTWKLGINWAINSDVRIRASRQTAFRAPNLGEFASPITALSLALFDQTSEQFVPRFAGRFDGDPCLLGTGNAEQCARYGAAPVGTPFDASTASYTFGGNPEIKPEQAVSSTLGLVYTPSYLKGFDVTLDYYTIEITDAVSQIQPAAALKNCYIDNPVAGNPLCDAVRRDPQTGLISTAIVNDFNLAAVKQDGVDLAVNYRFDAPAVMGGSMKLAYQGTIITKQTRQNNATLPAIDCKGTFGSACSGDFASVLQADYKHRMTLDWNLDTLGVQLGWRRIGEVESAADRSISIGAQNYIDLSASWQVTDELSLTGGIDNLLDKDPPLPFSGANHFNTVSDYSVLGRTVGISLRYKPAF